MSGRISRRAFLWMAMLSLSVSAGCEPDSPVAGGPPKTLSLDDAVVGAAAANLSQNGLFDLGSLPPSSPSEITPARAVELANADLRAFGPNLLAYLERTHGAAITLDRLTPSPRVYHAISPWEPLPKEVDPAVRQERGPYLFVTYLERDGIPVLSVAVPAYATSVSVSPDGRYGPQSILSGFFVVGISKDWNVPLPISPEEAVLSAASATGARAEQVPQLILPGAGYQPQWSRWRVKLERPVALRRVKGAADVIRTDEIFVGLRGSLYVPALRQPASVIVPAGPGRSMRLQRRNAFPVEFEQVVPAFK